MIQQFFSGFFSMFKLGVMPIKQVKTTEIEEYFSKIEQDINTSYKKLKSSYERK